MGNCQQKIKIEAKNNQQSLQPSKLYKRTDCDYAQLSN